jgi:hypothetical protein
MILILSEPVDSHAKVVASKLEKRRADFFWFDNAQYPAQAQISLRYATAERMQHVLQVGGKTFDLGCITAAWDRRPRPPVPHEEIVDELTREHVEKETMEFLRDVWHTLDCLWVPATSSTVQRARYKASQLKLASALGFEIPPTLITNTPQDFLEFYRQHNGTIVSKIFGSFREITKVVNSLPGSIAVIARLRHSSPVREQLPQLSSIRVKMRRFRRLQRP